MANRSIVYDEEQPDPFDFLWQYKDFLAAIGALELDLAGQTTTMVTGFTPTPTGPASLSINLTSGRIYQQSVMDSTAYGALASDSTVVQQQGAAPAQSVTLSTAGLSSGQSMWALVQAQFSQVDVVRASDPTGGVLNFWNTANPTQPFQGPNNDGSSQPTERKATVSIQVIYGTPASSGSEVPPNPTNGWVPLFLVDLAFAQTTITSGQILVAGPSVGNNVPNNYPGAPFLAGLLNQHHKGTAGQAPQIDLTAEVKNLLPLANLVASSTSGGGIGVMKLHAGNPNGNVAGNFSVNGASDLCIDTTNQLLYFCSATGTSSTAVWTSVSGATTSIFSGGTATGTVNAQVVTATSPTGFTKSPGQVVTFTGLNNTGATTLVVDGTGVSAVEKNTGSGDVPLTGGEMDGFVTAVWTGSIYLLQPGLLGQLATLNIGAWLKNDGSGNLTIKNGAQLGDDGSGNFNILPTGVTAGSYTRPKITVNAEGQLTSAASGAFPTRTVLDGGTGNYPVPTGAKRLFVRMIAAGGNGASQAQNGANGTQTSFNGVTCAPGLGGSSPSSNLGGIGGASATGGTGTTLLRIAGSPGSVGQSVGTSSTTSGMPGSGGVSPFGGGGASPAPNTGSGASGLQSSNPSIGGPGGGSVGEYAELQINNPVGPYSYTVGEPGSGGGNSAAAGIIIIDEYYD